MKKDKLFCFLLACMLLLTSAALADEGILRVTASFYPMYIATINVARDVPGLEINCLAPPSAGCLHDYQMSTDDRRTLEDADVLILNGAGLESFMEKLLPQLEANVINASEGIALLADDHHGVNGHVWVSMDGMMHEVRNIAAGLSLTDPAHKELYEANADAYIEKLISQKENINAALSHFAGEPIVTFHEAFDYFADEFGLRIVATVQSDHGSAPSARELADLADLIRAEGVKALFAEPQYEDTSVDILSRETGVPVYTLDPAVSGEIDPEDYDAYLRIMQQNADTIAEALQ